MTSVLCLHYCPETVHCSTKDAYNSEITFLTLHPCKNRSLKQTPADPAVCVLYEPHFLLETRFHEMSWLSVYLCPCNKYMNFRMLLKKKYLVHSLYQVIQGLIYQDKRKNGDHAYIKIKSNKYYS